MYLIFVKHDHHWFFWAAFSPSPYSTECIKTAEDWYGRENVKLRYYDRQGK